MKHIARRSSFVPILVVVAAACAADREGVDPVARTEAPLEAESQDSCSAGQNELARIHLVLREGEAGPIEVDRGESLQIDVVNEEADDAIVSLVVVSWSSAGGTRASFPPAHVVAGVPLLLEMPVDDMGLPGGTFEASGRLNVSADAVFGNGSQSRLPRLDLHFHPTARGWAIYDRSVRDEFYTEGALTEEEIARRQAAREHLPDGEGEHELASFSVRRVSDDPEYREPEIAPDRDQEQVER